MLNVSVEICPQTSLLLNVLSLWGFLSLLNNIECVMQTFLFPFFSSLLQKYLFTSVFLQERSFGHFSSFVKLLTNTLRYYRGIYVITLWQINFVFIILFVLTLASDMAVLWGNDALSILVLSTKSDTPVFWKRFSISRKFVLELKYRKRSNFPLIVT